MDELLIDDKKYLSTKRAAKVTGYAKDYVGQLCREGRVQARLVGRSWYVLETAIREHRFGSTEPSIPAVSVPRSVPEEAPVVRTPQSEKPTLQATWSPPRYFPESGSDIPYLHSAPLEEPKETMTTRQTDLAEQSAVPVENINQAWREWFADRAENAELPVGEEPSFHALNILTTKQESPVAANLVGSVAPDSSADEEVPLVRNEGYYRQPIQPAYEGTAVPISSVWKNAEPTLPLSTVSRPTPKRSRVTVWIVRVVGLLLAAVAISIALLGSGRFDTSGIAHGYLGRISGINTVNK